MRRFSTLHVAVAAFALLSVCAGLGPAGTPPIRRATPAAPVGAVKAPAAASSFRAAPVSQMAQYLPYVLANPNTTVDVLRDQGPEFRFWQKDLILDWRNGRNNLAPRFRWSTKEKGVVSAVWQVSTFRFTSDATRWAKPAGLVASGMLGKAPAAGRTEEFNIDFATFAPLPPAAKVVQVTTTQATRAPAMSASAAPRRLTLQGVSHRRASTPATQAQAILLKMSPAVPAHPPGFRRTYAVRVVPLNAQGACVGLPSEAAQITYGDPPPQEVIHIYTAEEISAIEAARKAKLPKLNHPVVQVLTYQPIRPQAGNYMYRYVVIRQIGMAMGAGWKVGDKLDFTPHQEDKSWWDDIGGFFSGVADFVAGAANWVADAYQSIKDAAVSWAPDWAKGPLTMAMDAGLAACGIPPTLPSFDELAGMGTDYLVKTAADAAGVPPEVAGEAVNAMIDGARSASNGGGGNPAVWLKPDPDFRYRPAYVQLQVSNPTDKPTDRAYIDVGVTVPEDPDAVAYAEPLFTAEYVPLPPLQPWETLTVPVMLKEYTQLRQLDTDPFAGEQRFKLRYWSMPASLRVWTDVFTKTEVQNPVVGQQAVRLEHAYQSYAAP